MDTTPVSLPPTTFAVPAPPAPPFPPLGSPPPPGIHPDVYNFTFTAEEMRQMLEQGVTAEDVLRDLDEFERS